MRPNRDGALCIDRAMMRDMVTSDTPWALPQAVLFDVDGTLVDHESAAEEAVIEALAAAPGSPPLDHDRLTERWRELEAVVMDRYLAGELTFVEQRRLRITRLAEEFGLGTWPDDRADAWFARYLTHYEASWRTYADVMPTLATLNAEYGQLRLGTITNGDADQQRHKLERVGLHCLLQHATISSDVGAAKPDAKIFRTACADLQLRPSQVVYVGDRLQTDARAAIDAGLHGVWLDRQRTTTSTSVPRIRTLTQLVPLLNRSCSTA